MSKPKRSAKEIKEEVYRVFSELPEGKYVWGLRSGRYQYWNLMTVQADAEAELTSGEAGVTVKTKPGANGAGWQHAGNIGNTAHVILNGGVEVWISDCGRYCAFKVMNEMETVTEKVYDEATEIMEKLFEDGRIMMAGTQ